ncbi:hypothetical protein HD842_000777 [Massilia aurea]|uniref:DUF6968 domain-containing protein n=1 Tax=Massilia aurea TaxID=373040 RepID=A0A7W9U6T0_9BURK|nr:hypothetical protein [Massilia aurea]MBB6132666.1 hypothetical protein [Massilia aurea]
MTELFISRKCMVHPPQGSEFSVLIGVFAPEVTADQAWHCQLSFEGIQDKDRFAYGVDQRHALQMGVEMFWVELSFKTAMGWRFSWFGDERMEPDELLPHWG